MTPGPTDLRSTSAAIPAGLLEHVEHVGLEDVVDGLDADPCPALRHGEDVDHPDRVVVDELAEHEAHNLHRHAGPPYSHPAVNPRSGEKGGMGRREEIGGRKRVRVWDCTVLEHLEEREGGDVDLLGGVEKRRVRRWLPHPAGAKDPLQPLHGFLTRSSIWSGEILFSGACVCLRRLLDFLSSSARSSASLPFIWAGRFYVGRSVDLKWIKYTFHPQMYRIEAKFP